ncbi:hypothetical protein ACFOSV_08995 [Algoriphagus namhaensis]|uniref:NADH dehydrogenase n=1 Tax=Algoriphagus namhaensis TaxID=915353 RepID=A0ABV8ARH1_9BACT
MINKLRRGFKSLFSSLAHWARDYHDEQLLATGALLSKQQYLMNSSNIHDYEFKIFSQFGDDGIIQYLIKHVEIENETFIEFGVEDYMESNTRFLLLNNNWSGYVMDGSANAMNRLGGQSWYWKHALEKKAAFIDKNNINELLSYSGFSNLGLLHIDLDGNDYYILETIDFERYNPSILVLEYNAVFGKERAISVPYDPTFVRTKKHYSNLYFGASLPALTHEAERKGYKLVACNLAGNNAYFIREDLMTDRFKALTAKEAFVESKFRESRAEDHSLSLLSGEKRLELIKGLEVFNVISKQTEKL